MAFEILRHFPLVSAVGWFLITGFQLLRDRYHTWTERFFLFACISAGFYAVWDWLFFNAPVNDAAAAMTAAIISMASVTLTALFLFLFTLVYVGRWRRRYWLYAAVTAVVLFLIPSGMIVEVDPPGPGELWRAIFDPPLFGIFLIYIVGYGLGGVGNLYRLYKIVRHHSERLARRTRGLVITFAAVLIMGLATNGYLGLVGERTIPPPFSTLLIAVAAALAYVLYPGAGERISTVIQRFKATRYEIKAAFLIFADGTLIASKIRPGERIVDTDLFSATLDVIQNFMRTSFPGLRGKWLRSIAHGDYTIVMERGRYAYLTSVLEGEETDQLRRQMRDLLREFEARNREVLANWRGVPQEAVGVDTILAPLIEGERAPL